MKQHLQSEQIDRLAYEASAKVSIFPETSVEKTHLKTCASCRSLVEEALFSKQLLRSLPRAEKAPHRLRLEIERMFRHQEPRPGLLSRLTQGWLLNSPWAKSALVTIGMFLVLGGAYVWHTQASLKKDAEDPLSLEWAFEQNDQSVNTDLTLLTEELEEMANEK